ncbi:choline transporter-like protein ctl1 [Podospora conica]|nr:choline transporter-like protein ctl1 [Schizothecium conicum]
MFSEYASRFLAQSQSRLSNLGDGGERSYSQPGGWQGRGPRLGRQPYAGRGAGNPYQPSASRFGSLAGFGSRYAQDAPLFQATLEHDEDDEEERDREDLYALQHSRRVFATSRLDESTETEHDGSRASVDASQDYEETLGDRIHGIKSSWNGNRSLRQNRDESGPGKEAKGRGRSLSNESNETKGFMEDVGLESVMEDREPPLDLTVENPDDSTPAPFQKFKSPAEPNRYPGRRPSFQDSELGMRPRDSSVDTNITTLPIPASSADEIFRHDAFFAWIFLIAQASMLSTFVLVFLHTSGKRPMGDTIYNTLRASFHMLAIDTVVSVIVAMVWLAALRSFVKPLVGLITVAVPVVLVSFSLYAFISSYQSGTGSSRLQDVVMRWAAAIPATSAVVWVYLVYKGRYSIRSAIEILEFSSRILAANSALVLVGMGCLVVIVLWTWAWLLMFTRVFMGGNFSSALSRFIISASSWWLGIFFVLMYIWTLSIISGIQRCTTAATVSQWYFHRNAVPATSPADIVSAAMGHSVTTIFGSISLSTVLALGIRLPLLVLPQRAANIISMFAYRFIPTPIAALTNPLTLTYAAIHSQTLAQAARGLSQMDFLLPQRPTTTLTPATLPGANKYSPLLPYRLAKLILYSMRFIMATGLGFAGWVMTARLLGVERPDGSIGIRGSAYAYVVGLVAGFIGWGVLGAMEGILSGIVDAVVICYGSEKRMISGGGGYCMEAAYLFGDRRAPRD